MRRGVDFDGTLAFYETFEGPDVLGEPIPEMVERVKRWLAQGDDVAICTARVHPSHGDEASVSEVAIRNWCVEHLGQELEVTCMKDPLMEEIWDDRAVRVTANEGTVDNDFVEDAGEEEECDGVGEFLS
jgi:hypothetical protein